MSRAAARLLARAAAAPAPAPAPPASARAIASAANDATFSFGKAQAQFYDDVLVDGIFKPWTESMFATSRPVTGDAVLDVACGTGVVARECAALVGESVGDGRAGRPEAPRRRVPKRRSETKQRLTADARVRWTQGKVTAIDNSPGMLARAKANPASRGIEYLEFDACAPTLPRRAFDRAYCQQGLQFMADPTAAMKAVLSSLKRGGHFTCAVWAPANSSENQIIYHLGEALRDVGREDWVDVAVKPMSWSNTDSRGVSKLEDCLIEAGFINPDVACEDGTFAFDDLTQAVDIAKVGPYGEELASDDALWREFSENFRARLKMYVQEDGRVVVPARSFIGHGVAPWN